MSWKGNENGLPSVYEVRALADLAFTSCVLIDSRMSSVFWLICFTNLSPIHSIVPENLLTSLSSISMR